MSLNHTRANITATFAPRFMCNPGLGFKAPAEARVGNYIDKKCPFTGKVSCIGAEIENRNVQMVEEEETHCLVVRCPSVDVSSLVWWPS